MADSAPFRGKVALVTGAARRIGRAIALRLAAEGATVAVHYHQSEQDARRTAEESGARLFNANLEHVPEIHRLFTEVEQAYGRLDFLVNNAARFEQVPALEITEEAWDQIHNVNLKAVFFCCQAGARLMLKNGGGKIVNLSSLGGIRPWSEHAHYCASKAGVIMLTRVLAKAFAPHISVNSVAPGVVHFEGEMTPRAQRLVAATPMRRAGTGEEIAEAVVSFLRASPFVTGQVLAVDGGLSQRA
ncbi:MAG: SDR family oxidoreductase [Acidobacteria bacterium]|nr:SDR family oxidoreductase [Acidobacteriota bacterium]